MIFYQYIRPAGAFGASQEARRAEILIEPAIKKISKAPEERNMRYASFKVTKLF
jgi:hypothetical protein